MSEWDTHIRAHNVKYTTYVCTYLLSLCGHIKGAFFYARVSVLYLASYGTVVV